MILTGLFQLKIFYNSKIIADSHFLHDISAFGAPGYCFSPGQHQWAASSPCPTGGVTQLPCLFCRTQLTFHHWPAHRTPCPPPHHPVNMSCSSSRLETHHPRLCIPLLHPQPGSSMICPRLCSKSVAELGNTTNAAWLSTLSAGACGGANLVS